MKDSLIYSLHKLVFVLDYQSDTALHKAFGFGFSQFKILMAVKRNAGLKQSDIARFLGQTEASVSRQLKFMVEDGLLKVKTDKQNRRKHIVVLTELGLSRVNEAGDVLQETHAGIFGSLSYSEQLLMKELISRLESKANLKKQEIDQQSDF